MARLSKASFLSKWSSIFQDNSTRAISEEDMRDFRQDIADSFFGLDDDAYSKAFPRMTTSGTNSYTATANPAVTAYSDGQEFLAKFSAASTGSVTLDVSGIGSKKVYKDPTTQAGNGDIPAGQIAFLVYDSSLDSAAGGFLIVGGTGGGSGIGTFVPLVTEGNTVISDDGGEWNFELGQNGIRLGNIRGYASGGIFLDGATSTLLQSGDSSIHTNATDVDINSSAGTIKLSSVTGLIVTDNQAIKTGLKYAASGYATEPLSLMTREDVEDAIGSASYIPSALNSSQIIVGNALNVATAVAMSGAISINNAGVTSYSGTVPINKGGTNNTTFTTNGVTYYDGTSITSNSSLIYTGSLFGIGLTPTSRLHVQGAASGTASMVKFQNSTPSELFDLHENGSLTLTGGASGAGGTTYTFSPTLTATANSQTQYGIDVNMTLVDGGFTSLTRSFARFRTGGSGTNLYDFGTSTFTTTSLTSADFNGGSMKLRNITGVFNIQGGSGSTDVIRFSGVFTNSTDNHIAFRFTNGGSANSTALHTAGTAITRTWNSIVKDWTVSSVNGSTITYNVDKINVVFSLGNSTATITGYDYNPDLSGSSGTITHYAMRVRSGLSAFGHANAPTAFMDLAAGTTASASLRIRTGTAPTSPNDGDIWQDGTDLKIRIGGVTKTFTLV